MAGNVWEWTATAVWGNGFVLHGGSYASPPLYAKCTFLNAAPAELRSPGIGLRWCASHERPSNDFGDGPLAAQHGLIILGCSRRKLQTDIPVPALELYQGGCVPQLRERLGYNEAWRAPIRILSAAHGQPRPLLVAEYFGPTIQGEGPSTGQQALFIRLSRCNLVHMPGLRHALHLGLDPLRSMCREHTNDHPHLARLGTEPPHTPYRHHRWRTPPATAAPRAAGHFISSGRSPHRNRNQRNPNASSPASRRHYTVQRLTQAAGF